MGPPCWSCSVAGGGLVTPSSPQPSSSSLPSGMVEGVLDRGWHATLSYGLHQAWETGMYTDLVIQAQDEVIHAHKVVLAATSPYFRAMLSVGLVEGQTQTLVLEDVAGETINTVLRYVYTGYASLTQDNAQHILTLADYFQIHSLKKLCCYHLKNNLVMDTCLKVYEVAMLHQCHDLAAEALSLACSHCSQVLLQPSLTSLQPHTLLALFQEPYLNIDSEEDLFNGAIQWVSADSEERLKWLPDLLNKIDLHVFDQQQRTEWLEVLHKNGLATSAVKIIMQPTENVDNSVTEKYTPGHMRSVPKDEVLLVVGGESSGRLLGNMECFAVGYASWRCSLPCGREVQVLPAMQHPRAYCAVAAHHNTIHILGGQTSRTFLSSCERFSLSSNQWEEMGDLPVPVHGGAAAFLDGRLYYAGGKSLPTLHNHLWVYEELQAVWRGRQPMSTRRGHFGLGSLHGSLYAVGGVSSQGGTSRVLSTCEKYDPASDSWTPIAPLGKERAYLGVAVINNHLYAIGGYDGTHWLSSVERYDPLRDQWMLMSSMISARSSFGVTVSYGRIYCLGGFSGESILNSVEKYNPRTNMWHCVQSMQLRRYGLAAATLVVPTARH